MRRTKSIEVAGQAVTISEIPVSVIFRLFRGEESLTTIPAVEAAERVKALIPLAFEGNVEALLSGDLFYDDLQAVYEAFKETNPAFFEMARALKLTEALAGFVKTLLQSFSNRLLFSLNTAMGPSYGSGDTVSS
ncbi:MAG: hypothetical protein CXR31_04485 [Geobacter sp.]|nr:MAG: hypothetical protein CXR31_04485 [Geobacter sp.]